MMISTVNRALEPRLIYYKSVLADELKSEKTFAEMCSETWQKYFGQSPQNYYHVMNATGISQEIWSHNDFPYQKFLANDVDESILTWKPSRNNPSQLNSDVQSKLTATLGKHAVIIPPELEDKLKIDPKLREKVIANLDNIYKFHTQPPKLKMPGVKEYGTKIFGSVTILNADGEVENCVVTSGGTIMAPDEETLRQIEHEQAKLLII
ncbi:MAG: hypothetical protein SR3Q1_01795 [Quinella sp. 3Q1]|nr:hypothetical protein [Quinella sp. 3Q1]